MLTGPRDWLPSRSSPLVMAGATDGCEALQAPSIPAVRPVPSRPRRRGSTYVGDVHDQGVPRLVRRRPRARHRTIRSLLRLSAGRACGPGASIPAALGIGSRRPLLLVPRPCGDEPIVAKLPSGIIDTKGPVDGAAPRLRPLGATQRRVR